MILVSPDKVKLRCDKHFRFKAFNNLAEYEALVAGLRLSKEVSACHLIIYSDSQLIVNQVNFEYQTKQEKMVSYLEKAKELLRQFDTTRIIQVLRTENTNANTLSRLATGLEDNMLKSVPIEVLEKLSIKEKKSTALDVVESPHTNVIYQLSSSSSQPSWKDPIITYLRDEVLPDDKFKA